MYLKRLLTLTLITTSLLTIAACGRKEVVSVEVPTSTETVTETVKPAEPVVVSVEPINEAKEEEVEVMMPAPDLDYYGKVETEKTTYTTGLPTISEDASASTSAKSEEELAKEIEEWSGATFEHVTYFEGGTW